MFSVLCLSQHDKGYRSDKFAHAYCMCQTFSIFYTVFDQIKMNENE